MYKKVIIISSSLRKNSNSQSLASAFKDGAIEAGNQVVSFDLSKERLNFCIGCLACQKTHRCVIDDDARKITDAVKNADVVVFASPVYYYSISGALKTLLDRLNPVYGSGYRFREVYFLTCAFENEESTPKRAISAVQGWVDCFDKAALKKTIFAGGVNEPGEIKNHPAINEAYECGKSLI